MWLTVGIIIGILAYHVIISAISKRSAAKDIYEWQDRQTDFQDKLLEQWEAANLYQDRQADALEEISKIILKRRAE